MSRPLDPPVAPAVECARNLSSLEARYAYCAVRKKMLMGLMGIAVDRVGSNGELVGEPLDRGPLILCQSGALARISR